MNLHIKAALFDLDGVILDTESQYSTFWGGIGRRYRSSVPDFGNLIKGQTLTQIYDAWFSGETALQSEITAQLNAFEEQMVFPYISGAEAFIRLLHSKQVPMVIVTSSNQPKMRNALRAHPELPELFSRILTSEDFTASKPAPDCYELAARVVGVPAHECVVFEDSINGLRAARDAGAFVVGLATTNPPATIAPLADLIINDFTKSAAAPLINAFSNG